MCVSVSIQGDLSHIPKTRKKMSSLRNSVVIFLFSRNGQFLRCILFEMSFQGRFVEKKQERCSQVGRIINKAWHQK